MQELPDVTRSTSYGTPALKVGTRGRVLARLWEDSETLVVRVDPAERAGLLAGNPTRTS